ncbi:MAG TPA: hypothetical protein PKD53_24315 [Chloroflexaceae bacterium]|nr:hypothetical protein [Chloroflexaceae bacterium]
MERIALLHSRLQLTISALLAVLVVWGLISAWRGRVGQGYLAAIWVAALLIGAQALLGLALLLAVGLQPNLALHIVYGAVAAATLPAAVAYNRGRDTRWEALVFAAACLFLLGVVIRAFETAV